MTNYDQVVSDIYLAGAALQPWKEPLQGIADLTGSEHVMLQSILVQNDASQLLYSFDNGNVDPIYMEYYCDYITEYGDPRAEALTRYPQGAIVQDHEFISEREMSNHPYYEDVLQKNGLRYSACVAFQSSSSKLFGISLQRKKIHGPVDANAICMFERLAEHMHRAAFIESNLTIPLKFDKQFDHVLQANRLCIMTLEGQIIQDSADLDKLSEEVSIKGGQLRFKSHKTHQKFLEKLSSVASGKPSVISLGYRQKRLWLYPAPLDSMIFFPKTNVVLVVEELGLSTLASESIKECFGLTNAEISVLSYLVMGSSIDQISKLRSVSKLTVRTQLKSIYAKLGVCSQCEAIALAARVEQSASATSGV